MKILSTYISTTFLRLLGLTVGAFSAIYLIIDFLEKIGGFSQSNPRMKYVLLYFLFKIPEIIGQVLPMSILLATLLALGMLSRTNEITAMRSTGMSMSAIALPLVAIGAAISIFSVAMNELVLPSTFQKMRYIEQIKIKKKDYGTFFRRNNIWHKDDRFILQARLFDPHGKRFQGVTLWEVDDRTQPSRRIEAREMHWQDGQWILSDLSEKAFNDAGITAVRHEKEKPVQLKLRIDDLKVISKYGEDMGFFELRRYIQNLEESGYDATRYRADLHGKISYPFASLIMIFLGIPFALSGSRSSGIALGVAQSVGIGFAYFVINAIVMSFGHSGLLHPLVSAWATNFIFLMIGIWFGLKTV